MCKLNHLILFCVLQDFFTEDLWARLNPRWITVLDELTPDELANFVAHGVELKYVNIIVISFY